MTVQGDGADKEPVERSVTLSCATLRTDASPASCDVFRREDGAKGGKNETERTRVPHKAIYPLPARKRDFKRVTVLRPVRAAMALFHCEHRPILSPSASYPVPCLLDDPSERRPQSLWRRFCAHRFPAGGP